MRSTCRLSNSFPRLQFHPRLRRPSPSPRAQRIDFADKWKSQASTLQILRSPRRGCDRQVWSLTKTNNGKRQKKRENASSDFHAAVSTGDSRPQLVPIFRSARRLSRLSAGQRSTLSRITPPPRRFSPPPLSRNSPAVSPLPRPDLLPLTFVIPSESQVLSHFHYDHTYLYSNTSHSLDKQMNSDIARIRKILRNFPHKKPIENSNTKTRANLEIRSQSFRSSNH